MRLIIPILLTALMLPYATSEDHPTGEWLIKPDPTTGVVVPAAAAAAAQPARRCAAASRAVSTTQPAATQPALARAGLP